MKRRGLNYGILTLEQFVGGCLQSDQRTPDGYMCFVFYLAKIHPGGQQKMYVPRLYPTLVLVERLK